MKGKDDFGSGFAEDVVLVIFAAPILVVKGAVNLVRWVRFWKVSYTASVPCRNCGEPVWLVGMWRCACGYTYRGHVLRVCPACGSWPRMVRCESCGVTELLPRW